MISIIRHLHYTYHYWYWLAHDDVDVTVTIDGAGFGDFGDGGGVVLPVGSRAPGQQSEGPVEGAAERRKS